METETIDLINDYDGSLDNNDFLEYTDGLTDENYENYINDYDSSLDNNDFLEYTDGLDENYENYINDYDGSLDNNDILEYTDGLTDENYENYSSYNEIINIKTLNEKYPLINWKLYFEKIFEFLDIEIPIDYESIISAENDFKYEYRCLEEIDKNDLIYYIEW